jgi:LytS/YehU family sensor histidine kinase
VRGVAIDWCHALQMTFVNSSVVLVLVPFIVWITRRWPIERKNWRAAMAAHIPACLVFSLAHSGLYWVACHASHEVGGMLFYRFHPNLLSYWAVVGFTQALDYLRKSREHEQQVARLRLSLLKSQLQPHFLFNTLHAVSAMMHVDVNGADTMISRLSQLLRMTLTNIGKDESTLAEELDFIRTYLDIERVRFGEKLEARIDAPAGTLDALVPTMVLQPLVENCIRHGISSRMPDGRIDIQARVAEDRLTLIVRDNGVGLSEATPLREGLGLSNTRDRLEQLYPAEHLFTVLAGPAGGVEVTVTIPLRKIEETTRDAHSHDHRRRRALGPRENIVAPQQ